MSHAEPCGASTGHVAPLQPNLCGTCGRVLTGKQKIWCSIECKWRGWDRMHPRFDFTPAASLHAHALRGRESKGQRILARLKAGPATTMELARVGGIRFGARILELRQAGHRITREDHRHAGDEWSTYTLEGSHD
jgi:hypothetical protein